MYQELITSFKSCLTLLRRKGSHANRITNNSKNGTMNFGFTNFAGGAKLKKRTYKPNQDFFIL